MKTKIPKSVNILGHDYSVSFVDQMKMMGLHKGECIYPDRKINISNSVKSNKEWAWTYFLHELKHGHQFESGMMQILDTQAAELDADSFASLIVSLQKQGIL